MDSVLHHAADDVYTYFVMTWFPVVGYMARNAVFPDKDKAMNFLSF